MPAYRVPNVKQLVGIILDESRRAVRDGLAIVSQEVNERYRAGTGAPGIATLGVGTGRLSRQPGPMVEMKEEGLDVRGRVYMPPSAPIYARVHEYGATIYPKRGKFLVFRSKRTGFLVFARKVVIPPRPIWRVSELRTREAVRARLGQVPRRVVERWAAA